MNRIKSFFRVLLMTSLLLCMFTTPAFAGQWLEDGKGWWYQNTDMSYLNGGWYWIGGNCYYFGADGYMYKDTTTPDGYTVNSSGQWVVNGVVQTTATSKQVGGMTVILPDTYSFTLSEESNGAYAVGIEAGNIPSRIAIMSVNVPGLSSARLTESDKDTLFRSMFDGLANSSDISSVSTDTRQYPSGTWRHFSCVAKSDDGTQTIPCHIYATIAGDEVRMVFSLGTSPNFDENQFMQNYIR